MIELGRRIFRHTDIPKNLYILGMYHTVILTKCGAERPNYVIVTSIAPYMRKKLYEESTLHIECCKK